MARVNLLPPSHVTVRRRRTRIKRWTISAIVAAVLSVIPLAVDVTKRANASSVNDEVGPLSVRFDAVRAELKNTIDSCTELKEQIAQADALRSKRPWAALLDVIVSRLPDAVWLTTLKTEIRNPQKAKELENSEGVTIVELEGPVRIRIEGYALNHQSIYEFISGLKTEQVFDHVELTSAGKEPVLRASAIRFAIVCDW